MKSRLAIATAPAPASDGQLESEQETRHLYRDSQTRTCTEAGSTVTINDPVISTTVALDVESRTYRDMADQAANTAPSERPTELRNSTDQQIESKPRSLGQNRIGGVSVEGTEYTVTIPAIGGMPNQQTIGARLAFSHGSQSLT